MEALTFIQRGDEKFVVSTCYVWPMPSEFSGYESRVFGVDLEGCPRIEDLRLVQRYATVKDADEGHRRICKEWHP